MTITKSYDENESTITCCNIQSLNFLGSGIIVKFEFLTMKRDCICVDKFELTCMGIII